MSKLDSRLNWFAVMWDCDGLEAVVKVPRDSDRTFAVLANQPPPQLPQLNHWRLRAQFNSHRHYEIYLVSAEAGIDAEDIRSMFEASPQAAADTIRRCGQQWYSARAIKKPAIV